MDTKIIIKLSRTTDNELMRLASSLGVKVGQIDYKNNLNRKVDYAIINMGNPMIGGTHWMAVSNKDKMYFDPLFLPRPRVIPSDYTYRRMRVQNPLYGHCGQYAVLWLYYLQNGKVDDFYKLFEERF